MDDKKPDEEFVSRLEWQLKSEFRRAIEFQADRQPSRLKTFLILLVAALAGFAVATGGQRFKDSERRELLLAQKTAILELFQARQGLVLEYLADLRQQAKEKGDLRETLAVSEFELHQINRDLLRAELDLEEIRITGLDPRNQITAPRVGGRDFVSERLQLNLETLLEKLALIRSEPTLETNAASTADENSQALYFAMEEAAVQSDIQNMERLLEIRSEFLAGHLSAREVALQTDYSVAKERLEVARSRRKAVELELANFEKRLQGDASSLDLRLARFQLVQATTDERLAELECKFLERKIGNSPDHDHR